MDNPSQKTIELMRALARKAERDPSFVAYALRAYMELERIDEGELRRKLGCSELGLLRLSLCRRPDVESNDFRQDVERCARLAGARETALANLLKAVRYKELVEGPGIAAARACDSAEPGDLSRAPAAKGGPSTDAEDGRGPDRPARGSPESPGKPEPEKTILS